MLSRRVSRRGIAAAVAGLVLIGVAGTAFAGTISSPGPGPFTVPADGSGNPLPFTVTATGFGANTAISVEQCDGKSPADPSWSATEDCDLGSSPAPKNSDASGNVTFDASDVNHAFHPFRGDSPQDLFNCLGPNDPATNSGIDDYGANGEANCQIRV